nr:MAG TPA: hypothetical protein [Caudoviricetes sp.]
MVSSVRAESPSWTIVNPSAMCVSALKPPIGQVGDGLVSQSGESVVDDSESVSIVLPESPGDDVVAYVESERLPAVGGSPLEADDLAGLVHPVVRVAPRVGGGADGVGDVGVGGDVLNGGGHCLVLSICGWVVCPPCRCLNHALSCAAGQHYATVTHPTKPMLCGVLTDVGCMWYTRAHVPIYTKGAPRRS